MALVEAPRIARGVAVLAFAFSAAPALADPEPWMKRKDPDVLSYFVLLNDKCKTFDLDQVVRGVMVRARLMPNRLMENSKPPDKPIHFWLGVLVNCIDTGVDLRPTVINIRFGTDLQGELVEYSLDYGYFGNLGSNDLPRDVRDGVEHAVSDYIEAQTKF
jgi:hypothetical protein